MAIQRTIIVDEKDSRYIPHICRGKVRSNFGWINVVEKRAPTDRFQDSQKVSVITTFWNLIIVDQNQKVVLIWIVGLQLDVGVLVTCHMNTLASQTMEIRFNHLLRCWRLGVEDET